MSKSRPSIKFKDMTPAEQQRQIIGLQRVATFADKSDPFAYARGMAHLKQGLAGVDEQGKTIGYDADIVQETRILPPRGKRPAEKYTTPVARDVKRI